MKAGLYVCAHMFPLTITPFDEHCTTILPSLIYLPMDINSILSEISGSLMGAMIIEGFRVGPGGDDVFRRTLKWRFNS